jgi:hypothetical protein
MLRGMLSEGVGVLDEWVLHSRRVAKSGGRLTGKKSGMRQSKHECVPIPLGEYDCCSGWVIDVRSCERDREPHEGKRARIT